MIEPAYLQIISTVHNVLINNHMDCIQHAKTAFAALFKATNIHITTLQTTTLNYTPLHMPPLTLTPNSSQAPSPAVSSSPLPSPWWPSPSACPPYTGHSTGVAT